MKNKKIIITHEQFYWPTCDEWYPCFDRNTVLIRLSEQTIDNNIFIRLSVWGADDFGMEKDFYSTLKEKNKKIKQLKNFIKTFPNPLSVEWLKQEGFMMA